MMFDALIAKGLVKQRRYENGLSVFKYSREVFYKALWNEDPLLLEARGMVLDDEGNKVIWPFTKVFNYNENMTTLDPDTVVVAPRKVNGFMAACRMYKGELIVSTTGTLDSDYAKMAREHIESTPELESLYNYAKDYTLLFEICDKSDPHIVEEDEGAYLIGARNMLHSSYKMVSETVLDVIARDIGALRPALFFGTFRQVLDLLKDCKHEGFMVRLATPEQETVMKLKSPHYLTKKFIMRMGKGKVEYMFNETEEFLKNTDEEFYPLVRHIIRWYTIEDWQARDDVARRSIIEDFFENTQR